MSTEIPRNLVNSTPNILSGKYDTIIIPKFHVKITTKKISEI